MVLMEFYKKSQFGEERRITDDMSELDIQLQNQTENVSIKEIMQLADSMHISLGGISPEPGQILTGEDIDGK